MRMRFVRDGVDTTGASCKMVLIRPELQERGVCDIVQDMWTGVGLPVRNVNLLVVVCHCWNKTEEFTEGEESVRPLGR